MGWCEESRIMIEPFYLDELYGYEGEVCGVFTKDGFMVNHNQSITKSIQFRLFTGMFDVNDKEVYEGHIVKRMCLDPNCDLEHIGEVRYSDQWCMFFIMDTKQDRRGSSYNAPLAFGDPMKGKILSVEILGDIYQNPELLK